MRICFAKGKTIYFPKKSASSDYKCQLTFDYSFLIKSTKRTKKEMLSQNFEYELDIFPDE